MALAHCMLDTYGYGHTLTICNIQCFSTSTMAARTRPNVTLYVLSILEHSPLTNRRISTHRLRILVTSLVIVWLHLFLCGLRLIYLSSLSLSLHPAPVITKIPLFLLAASRVRSSYNMTPAVFSAFDSLSRLSNLFH
jgi:hypothetical protein